MTNKANIYPKTGNNSTMTYSDSSKANIGLCFSGGGSRALSCGWGQLLGLKTLNLIDKARYISSVSGGTWALSVYSYLPDHISDEELLGTYYPPQHLSLSEETGNFNLNYLNQYSLGQVPIEMDLDKLVVKASLFLLLHSDENHKWLWADVVASNVLEPYGLRAKGRHSWSSSKYFSLSSDYVNHHFPENAPSADKFFFLREGRPFIIMNDNLIERVQVSGASDSNIVQLPSQATPIATGVQGQTPNLSVIGGGSVESYAYSSTLQQDSAHSSPVEVKISQPYSLIDIVSTSSVFFAETLANLVKTEANDDEKRKTLISRMNAALQPEHKKVLMAKSSLLSKIKSYFFGLDGILSDHLKKIAGKDFSKLGSVVPRYNYWSLGEVSKNTDTEYTDGGTLENTGVIGMLAQTDTGEANQDPIHLVVFINTSTPLEKKGDKIIVADQMAPLFGIKFNTKNGEYQAYTDSEKEPTDKDFDSMGLLSVFDNTAANFDELVNGLYAASCGASSGEQVDDSKVNTDPAFYQIVLTTVDNPLANITAGRSVNLLCIQNSILLNWQNEIMDEQLKKEIVDGQNKVSVNPFTAFQGFPYYSTFTKIGLIEKESNALSQMWAWAIADDASPLQQALQDFFEAAT